VKERQREIEKEREREIERVGGMEGESERDKRTWFDNDDEHLAWKEFVDPTNVVH
jgi:hypothetical protein